MSGMHTVIHTPMTRMVVLATGFTTVVTRLSLAMFMVLTITLALVRRAVALATGVVITGAHWRFAFVRAFVIVVVHLVLVIHLVPLLFANS
jgi:hypothetical protein